MKTFNGSGREIVGRLFLLLLTSQMACSSGRHLPERPTGTRAESTRRMPGIPRDFTERTVLRDSSSRDRETRTVERETRKAKDWTREAFGGRDGADDSPPAVVPLTLDYFQGFLLDAGIPSTAMPVHGRALSPEQALRLLPHLLSTPVTLGNFGPRRMAAHLLLEVATGSAPVSRDELHARMRRFSRLRVLRPDGYLVIPATGLAVQKVGAVQVAEDGTLRADRFEVGPFYAIDGGRLFPVDDSLEVSPGARPVGLYTPDDGVVLPAAEGAVLAVVDLVEGLSRLAFHTDEALEGLLQLPGAARVMYENAPRLWEEFRHKPHAERVRIVSRLTTGAVLLLGTSGAGAARVAAWGGTLGGVSVPLLSLSGEGLLAVRLVAVPVGGAVASVGSALGATTVLHMASMGARGAGGGKGWPPVGGPGRWVEDTSSMSDQARAYQAQVTGAPRRWCYRVCRGGECVNYDGFDPKTHTLLEAKAREYDKWFDKELQVRFEYEGVDGLINQAQRQQRLAADFRVRWHVAEPRMVAILKKLFRENNIEGIEVVHTPPLP